MAQNVTSVVLRKNKEIFAVVHRVHQRPPAVKNHPMHCRLIEWYIRKYTFEINCSVKHVALYYWNQVIFWSYKDQTGRNNRYIYQWFERWFDIIVPSSMRRQWRKDFLPTGLYVIHFEIGNKSSIEGGLVNKALKASGQY